MENDTVGMVKVGSFMGYRVTNFWLNSVEHRAWMIAYLEFIECGQPTELPVKTNKENYGRTYKSKIKTTDGQA
jgi:hypothetical protein